MDLNWNNFQEGWGVQTQKSLREGIEYICGYFWNNTFHLAIINKIREKWGQL